MRTLTKKTDSFDKINSFGIEYKNWRGQKDVKGVYLMQDYEKDGDGIYWAMSKTVCVSSHVTQAESDELDRIYNNPPVVDGELVLIDGIIKYDSSDPSTPKPTDFELGIISPDENRL